MKNKTAEFHARLHELRDIANHIINNEMIQFGMNFPPSKRKVLESLDVLAADIDDYLETSALKIES